MADSKKSVIPAKAGIQEKKQTGFTLKGTMAGQTHAGMTSYVQPSLFDLAVKK